MAIFDDEASRLRRRVGLRDQPDTGGSMRTLPTAQTAQLTPFADPTRTYLEDLAVNRVQQLQQPVSGSGQAEYEAYLRGLSNTLQQPVYAPAEEQLIKTGAIDAMTRERDALKQRWLEEVSRRGFSPSSGPALEGLMRIEQHYSQGRTGVEADFARQAIDQTRQQRFQTAETLRNLAQTQEGRQDRALAVGAIPHELQANEFQRALQLLGFGGQPTSLLHSAMTAEQQRAAQQAQLAAGLMQYLGYLFGGE